MKVKAEKYLEYKKWYFKIYDDYLDKASYEPKWLLKIDIAAIVKEAIHNSDGKEYELIAYCITFSFITCRAGFIPLIRN